MHQTSQLMTYKNTRKIRIKAGRWWHTVKIKTCWYQNKGSTMSWLNTCRYQHLNLYIITQHLRTIRTWNLFNTKHLWPLNVNYACFHHDKVGRYSGIYWNQLYSVPILIFQFILLPLQICTFTNPSGTALNYQKR